MVVRVLAPGEDGIVYIDFWSNSLTLFGHFLDRGYPAKLLAKSLIKASNQERDKLLQTKPKETKEEMEEKLLFAITTFFPNYPILKSSILDVWDLMGKSPTTNHLFDKRIICGNRRLKNLPDLTVRAGLPKTGHALVTNPQTEHTPCLNPNRCRYCPKLDHSGHISCPST